MNKKRLQTNCLYDGISIHIRDEVSKARLESMMVFYDVHKDTLEAISAEDKRNYPRAKYKEAKKEGLIFRIYHDSSLIVIRGSLHVFSNKGIHNYNRFTIKALNNCLKKLQEKYLVNLHRAEVHLLEIGINILTLFNPKDLIDRWIMHKNYPTNWEVSEKIYGKTTLAQKKRQYCIKIYDKGGQFREFTLDHILRFEIKYFKMEALKKGKIYLSDLLKPNFILLAQNALINKFSELLIIEQVDEANLSLKEKLHYYKCQSITFWESIKDKTIRSRAKAEFDRIITENATTSLKKTSLDLIKSCL